MHRVQAGPVNGLLGLLVLLGALSATVGLGAVGWLVGLGCGAGGVAWVARGLVRQESTGLGPANAVTLTRGVLKLWRGGTHGGLPARVGLPWLRGSVPPRYWYKVVAALQGVVLTVAMAEVLPRPVAGAAFAVALLLLAESFGRDVWQLWRARPGGEPAADHPVIADRARDA